MKEKSIYEQLAPYSDVFFAVYSHHLVLFATASALLTRSCKKLRKFTEQSCKYMWKKLDFMEKHHFTFHLGDKSSPFTSSPNPLTSPSHSGGAPADADKFSAGFQPESIILTSNVLCGSEHHLRCSETPGRQGRWGQGATEECWSRRSEMEIRIANHQDFTHVVFLQLACHEKYFTSISGSWKVLLWMTPLSPRLTQ